MKLGLVSSLMRDHDIEHQLTQMEDDPHRAKGGLLPLFSEPGDCILAHGGNGCFSGSDSLEVELRTQSKSQIQF